MSALNIPFQPKKLALALACVSQMAAAQPAAEQLPTDGQIAAGQAAITQIGSQMTINQASQSAILEWQSFNVGSAAGVTFTQPDASSVALNRVTGQGPSQIYGSLNANGQVFLVNPDGVLFAPGAQVNVGGLVASTLDIANQDFMAGNYRFNRNGVIGSVINAGDMSADYISLLAPEVINEGVISARMVVLAGGESVRLNISGNQLLDITVDQASIDTLVENRHLVKADDGQVIMSAQSANDLLGRVINSGAVEANGLVNDGGVVRLLASDAIDLNGKISANAGTNGNGGSIVAIADLDNPDSSTQVSGALSAQGGSESGNGGFIETSASNIRITPSASISTLAQHGLTGQWLIDPFDFYVSVSGGNITGSTLSTQLASNNVTLQTTNGSSGTAGDLFVNDAVNWSANTLLTLDAQHDIIVNAPVTASGGVGAGLALEFGQNKTADDFTNNAQYVIRAPINLSSAASFSTSFGSDGSATNFTVVTDASGLANISTGLTANYVLGSDITLAGEWTPLGNGTSTVFDGIFDGLMHRISGLQHSNSANDQYVGLFGSIGINGLVQNVGIINPTVAGAEHVGALAGNNNGLIANSYVSGGTVTGSDVVGADNDSTVGSIGGLVGSHDSGGIVQSYSSADVTATTGDQQGELLGGAIGGLVGSSNAPIDFSYASGDVAGITDVGGFVGWQFGAISSSYSTGAVSGTTNVGGFSGKLPDPFPFALPGLLTDTFWDTQTSGQATSADDGTNSSTGLTTAQAMQSASYGSWDPNPFYPAWIIREDSSYPLLRVFMPPLTVMADDQSKTYDGNVFGGTYTATLSNGSQINNGASVTGLSGTLSFSGDAITATDANTYTITPGGLSVSSDQHGYLSVNVANGTLTIDPAALIVTTTGLTGEVRRTYDGTTDATLASGNFVISGFAGSDGATVTETVGTFDNRNVGDNKTVSVTLEQADYTATGSTNLNNYELQTGTITGDIGFIEAKIISLTDLSVTPKEYDGTTDLPLENIVGTGAFDQHDSACGTSGDNMLCAGDSVTLGLTGTLTATYNDKDVADATTVTITGLGLSGDDADNYSLAPLVLPGAIDPKPIQVALLDGALVSKVYDGTTAADADDQSTLFSQFNTDYSTWGFVDGDLAGAIWTNSLVYNTKDVGADSVTITYQPWYVINAGTDLNNYSFPSTQTFNVAQITPKELSGFDMSGVSINSRAYDGTTDATHSGSPTVNFNGSGCGTSLDNLACAGDSANLTVSINGNGTYTSPDVAATDNFVTFTDSQFLLGGSAASNYTPRAVNIVLKDGAERVSKTYDGNVDLLDVFGFLSTWDLDYSQWGFVGDESALPNLDGTVAYTDANASAAVPIRADWSGWDAGDGTLLSNYQLPLFYQVDIGAITPRVINVNVGGTVSRAYDGTTDATLTLANFNFDTDNFIGSDGVSLGGTNTWQTGVFDNKNAGENKTITVNVDPADFVATGSTNLDNYSFVNLSSSVENQFTGNIGTITPLAVNLTTPVVSKIYDGGLGYTPLASDLTSLSASLVSGDTVTDATIAYTDKNAGAANKTVEISAAVISDGNNGGNYNLTFLSNSTSTIERRDVEFLPFDSVDKTYDGADIAYIPTTDMVAKLSGFVGDELLYPLVNSGDTINPGGNYEGSYDIKDAGDRDFDFTFADWVSSLVATDPDNYNLPSTLSGNGTISPLALTISGTTATDKVYDGTLDATINLGTLNGLIGSEQLGLSATGLFDNKNAGGRTATASYLLADGANGGLAANYTLASTMHSASITPQALTINGTTAVDRAYNGTTTASFNSGSLIGLIGSEQLNVSATGVFDSRNVGSRTTTANYQLANGANGGLAINYSLASTSGHSATISPKAVVLTPASVTKVYDGSTSYSGVINFSPLTALLGVTGDSVSGITITYSNANVGSNKTINASAAIVNDGNGGNNYTLSYAPSSSSVITRRPLTIISSSAADRAYDSTKSATVTPGTLNNLIGNQQLNVSATGLFNNQNAGDRQVTASYVLVDGANGGLAANYSLAATTHSATITPRVLTISGTSAADKVYDATTTATITPGALQNLVGDEKLNVTATGFFDTKNAGSRIATANYVLANGGNGGLATNYSLASTTGHEATITPKPVTINGIRAVSGFINLPVRVDGTPSIVGVIKGDTVNLTNIPESSDWYYENPRLDGYTPVKLNNGTFFTMAGTDTSNYSLERPVLRTLLISTSLNDVVSTSLKSVTDEGMKIRIFGGVATFVNLYNLAGYEFRTGTAGSGGGVNLAMNRLRGVRAAAARGQATAEQEQDAINNVRGQVQTMLTLLCSGRCEFSDADWQTWYSNLE